VLGGEDGFLCTFGSQGPVCPYYNDVWRSADGATWTLVSESPWNADGSEDVKYDFDSLVVRGGPGGLRPSIVTFGGDREASFTAPDPSLVDDEVWRFSPASRR
jgi:hypothetical protein